MADAVISDNMKKTTFTVVFSLEGKIYKEVRSVKHIFLINTFSILY